MGYLFLQLLPQITEKFAVKKDSDGIQFDEPPARHKLRH
jgi:hypothetical protein